MNIIFDGGDIDGHGSWYGSEIGCLECRETSHLTLSAVAILRVGLTCNECGTVFAEYNV